MRRWLRKLLIGPDPLSHDEALARIAARGLPIATLIDVGAAEGGWSRRFLRNWHEARCHLIEAKESWRPALDRFCAEDGAGRSYVLKGASSAPGEALFSEGRDKYAGSVLREGQPQEGTSRIPVTSIDAEVDARRLEGPFCIKLDTHGSEVDILKGALKTLPQTSLLCVETYNFFGQKRFPEMIAHLDELGFRVSDMAEPLFRPTDGALWQLDFYFQRKDDPVFRSSAYGG